MKKIIACLMACFAVFAFAACSLNKSGTPDSKGKEPLKIICTNFASYDFVRQIVGDKAEVTMLLKPGAEAHSYEPSPKDIQAIGKSDLFVYTGGRRTHHNRIFCIGNRAVRTDDSYTAYIGTCIFITVQ